MNNLEFAMMEHVMEALNRDSVQKEHAGIIDVSIKLGKIYLENGEVYAVEIKKLN